LDARNVSAGFAKPGRLCVDEIYSNLLNPRVYIETSIVSYLTARPSNDIRAAANQNTTIEWWETRRIFFELFVSEFVVAEAR
jgi:hypothetical protein